MNLVNQHPRPFCRTCDNFLLQDEYNNGDQVCFNCSNELIRVDFESVINQAIFLHPNKSNPIHQDKVAVWFDGKYFWSDIDAALEGPDYCMEDVFEYNQGFTTGGESCHHKANEGCDK